MDMMKSLLGLEGCRIHFTTPEGDYEGTIFRITPEIELLVIKQTVWLPKNSKLGMLTFRAKDIKAFNVISRPEPPKPQPELPLRYKYPHLYERDECTPNIFDDEFDETSSVHESDLESLVCLEDAEFEFDIPPSLRYDLPVDNVIIDEINDEFKLAINHIQQQDEIGFSLECPKISRNEDIHWLCISTSYCTFLFDIKTLGEAAFDSGLRDILDEPGILKIIHDCREVSDCLFHRYKTRLCNVYDTQVADFIINQQQRKKDIKINQYVYCLNSCVSKYLDIPDEFLFSERHRSYQDKLVFYGLRPLSHNLRHLFTKNVIYLRRLKQDLEEMLNEPLSKCIKTYTDIYPVMSNPEIELVGYKLDVVPNEMLTDNIQLFRFRDHVDIPDVVSSGPPYRDIKDPFSEFYTYCKKNEIGDA